MRGRESTRGRGMRHDAGWPGPRRAVHRTTRARRWAGRDLRRRGPPHRPASLAAPGRPCRRGARPSRPLRRGSGRARLVRRRPARAGARRGGERARGRRRARPRSRRLRRLADRDGMEAASRRREPPTGPSARCSTSRSAPASCARSKPSIAAAWTRARWAGDTASPPRRSTGRPCCAPRAPAGGVPALLDGLEPSYPHYIRNRRELARYRSLARAGEPRAGAGAAEGPRKVQPGARVAGHARAPRDGCACSATSTAEPAAADGDALRRRGRGGGEALPGPPHPRRGRRDRRRDHRGHQRPARPAGAPARAGDGTGPLASTPRRSSDHLRERPPVPALGLRPRARRRAAAHERGRRQVGEQPAPPSSRRRWNTSSSGPTGIPRPAS